MNEFRLLVPEDQSMLPNKEPNIIKDEDGQEIPAVVVSAAWLGRCKSWILNSRQLANFVDEVRNSSTGGVTRFYVEKINKD